MATILVVMMGYMSSVMNQRIELAENAKKQLWHAAAAHTKFSELSYMIATQKLSPAGFNQGKLRLDGFGYSQQVPVQEGNNESVTLEYTLQDTSGLLPLNSSDPYWLKFWLQQQGVVGYQQASLIDQLADYADSDSWQRPAGAESSAYIKEGLTAPANYLLQSTAELYRIPAWQSFLIQAPSLSHFSLSRSPTINLNAMPLDLWQQLWPNSAGMVALHRSQGRWIRTDEDLLALEPSLLTIQDEYYSRYAGRYIRVQVAVGGASKRALLVRGVGYLPPVSTYWVAPLAL